MFGFWIKKCEGVLDKYKINGIIAPSQLGGKEVNSFGKLRESNVIRISVFGNGG